MTERGNWRDDGRQETGRHRTAGPRVLLGMVWPVGVADAFTAFLHADSASLFRTAYLLTGRAELAEELLQDTLVRLYPRWDKVTSAD